MENIPISQNPLLVPLPARITHPAHITETFPSLSRLPHHTKTYCHCYQKLVPVTYFPIIF